MSLDRATSSPARGRLAALDIFRGLVMLVLVPDIGGGFGFYQMAGREPGVEPWQRLAGWFTHADWAGGTAWDIVMPSFVFMIGAALHLSLAARRERGESDRAMLGHLLQRVTALFVLGMSLLLPVRSLPDLIWPAVILSTALPWRELAPRLGAAQAADSWARAGSIWFWLVLAASILRLARDLDGLGDYNFSHLLMQVALAYPLAFAIHRLRLSWQIIAVAGLLAGYWLAFRLYPLPPPGLDLAALGVRPGETFDGTFAHWGKNTNLAAAFDAWLFAVLPRAVPFAFESHGYQTLNFIPTAASMLAGAWTARALAATPATGRGRLWLAGAAAVAAGWWLGQWWCPLVKSIWTPSWVVFSSGIVLLLFTACLHLADDARRRRWCWPLVALGSNAITIYVLAVYYRWPLVAPWSWLLGADLFFGHWQPLIEAGSRLLSLLLVAATLHRMKIFLRF